MRAMACCLFLILSAMLISTLGCSSGDFPTAETTGHVVFDGKPVPNLVVFFEPLQSGNSAVVGKQGIGRTGDDGSFEISTYGKNDGAVVGKSRVRVGWQDGKIDPSFQGVVNSENTLMEVEVKNGEVNDFEVVLPKKPTRAKLTLDEKEAIEEARDAQ